MMGRGGLEDHSHETPLGDFDCASSLATRARPPRFLSLPDPVVVNTTAGTYRGYLDVNTISLNQ